MIPRSLSLNKPNVKIYYSQDGILNDGLTDAYTPGMHMGHCGEDTAAAMNISRDLQDKYTVRSYNLAAEAYKVPDIIPRS